MKWRTIKWIATPLFAALLFGCSSDDDSAPLPALDDGETVSAELGSASPVDCESTVEPLMVAESGNRLAGSWSFVDESMCVQTFRFETVDASAEPGTLPTFTLTGAQEELSGRYVVLDPEDGLGPRLVLRFDADNQLPDCSEDTGDSTGATFEALVSFPSMETIRLADPGSPSSCSIYVRN